MQQSAVNKSMTMAAVPCVLIRAYQRLISPLLPHVCRFTPSCSEYALLAFRRHGAVKGALLSVRRLARCGPWCEGGVDEVPEPSKRDLMGKVQHRGRATRAAETPRKEWSIKWKRTQYMR